MSTIVNDNSIYEIKLKRKPVYDFISRVIDIYLSFVATIFALPFFIIAAVAIKIEDGGPIFYSQKRLGKNGKIFTIYKMRSMKIDAEKNGAQWAKDEDDRITKVGKFIRKTRIDEIPQLWNIYSGDMKIIGPRPERPELAEEFYKELPEFANRLVIEPGLTGLAQVRGGYDLTPAEKLVHDMEYVETRCFWLDVKIVFQTIAVVFSGDGAR